MLFSSRSWLHTPLPPVQGGNLANRLKLYNWRTSSVLRHHPKLGLLRLAIVGMRYLDRGGGGFMGGGAWVHEGRITCATYPETVDLTFRLPAVDSIAGWGSHESVLELPNGETVAIGARRATRPGTERYEKKFWTIEEAIAYANGEDGGLVAAETLPVAVRRKGEGYLVRPLPSMDGNG